MAASSSAGVPVLVRPEGSVVLERVVLEVAGKGEFDETWLQQLIHDNPDVLPIGELEPDLGRFTAICREVPVPGRGYIDNLLMTGAGHIALVETKLFRNPDARRQAIAQALDYATGLFALGYAAFEKAVLASSFSPSSKPIRLYDALPASGKLGEAEFIDAVSNNLRRGRALVLVVGDGIRSEAEALLDGMHAHARFGFTLALIELGVFRMPDAPGSYLVRPRTLMKTAIAQRTIVEVIGAGAEIKETATAIPGGIGTEIYWNALEAKVPGARVALEDLIRKLEPLGAYAEILGSLNLKWSHPNGGKPVNMGYIQKDGAMWVDTSAWIGGVDQELGYSTLAKAYVEDLAATFGGNVHTFPSGKAFTVYKDGSSLKLAAILPRLGDWIAPMGRCITALAREGAVN